MIVAALYLVATGTVNLLDVASPAELRAAWREGDKPFRQVLQTTSAALSKLQGLSAGKQMSIELKYLGECRRHNAVDGANRIENKWDYGRLETIAASEGKKLLVYKLSTLGPVRRLRGSKVGLEASETVRHKFVDAFPVNTFPLALTSEHYYKLMRAQVAKGYFVLPVLH